MEIKYTLGHFCDLKKANSFPYAEDLSLKAADDLQYGGF